MNKHFLELQFDTFVTYVIFFYQINKWRKSDGREVDRE